MCSCKYSQKVPNTCYDHAYLNKRQTNIQIQLFCKDVTYEYYHQGDQSV